MPDAPAPSPAPIATPGQRAFAPYDPRQARGRLLAGVLVGCAVGALLPAIFSGTSLALQVVAAWDAASLTYLALAWGIIVGATVDDTRRVAAGEDPGRGVAWVLTLASGTFSLFAAVGVLRRARVLEPQHVSLLVGLCLVAVVAAWSLTHTAFTLRYAHLYYREDAGGGEGGIDFAGGKAPDYFDLAYFGFTIGMCFQVSDLPISSSAIRRTVLGHAILSYAYTTAILALTLNLVFGFLG